MKHKYTPLLAMLSAAFLFAGIVGCAPKAPETPADQEDETALESGISSAYRSGRPTPVSFLQTKLEFERFVADNEIAVVKFGASWCGPCQKLTPELERMAGYFEDRGVKIVEIDVDHLDGLARSLGVQSIPDVRVYIGGNPYGQIVGYDPLGLASLIESVCQNVVATPPSPPETEGNLATSDAAATIETTPDENEDDGDLTNIFDDETAAGKTE